MAWRVLVSAPYMLPVLDDFRSILEEHDIEPVVAPVIERLSEDELLPLVPDIDGAICGDDRYTEKVMKAAPKLKVISKWGTGIDSIDSNAAARLGIWVCNTPGAFTDPVADTVMGYVLAFARQFPWLDRDMRAGRWEKRMGVSLHERQRHRIYTRIFSQIDRSRNGLTGRVAVQVRLCEPQLHPEPHIRTPYWRNVTGPHEGHRLFDQHLPRAGGG